MTSYLADMTTYLTKTSSTFWKFFILTLTLGISILASLYDTKSCYITILVQACNNIYDFAPSATSLRYNDIIRKESICAIYTSLASGILSVIAILKTYAITESMGMKLLGIFCVAIPLAFIYSDYKLNISNEKISR